jgi:drug/metabolite transporter (DMT)-like permease
MGGELDRTAIAIITAAVVLEVIGQVAFKRGSIGAVRASQNASVLRYWHNLLREAWIQLGIAVHVVGLLFWIAALTLLPLSIAFPLGSLSYCGVAIAGHYWLGEKINHRAVAAIAMITAGAALVGWARA